MDKDILCYADFETCVSCTNTEIIIFKEAALERLIEQANFVQHLPAYDSTEKGNGIDVE